MISITLISPRGTVADILKMRTYDDEKNGFHNFDPIGTGRSRMAKNVYCLQRQVA